MEIAERVHVVQCILSYIFGYTGPIFKIFSPYESSVCIDNGSVPHLPISQGTLPWQSILVKCHESWLIPLAFFALSFVNELQYHCLNVRANSGDDVAISCTNLVNFFLVTPEIMELIWECQVRHGQKTGVFHLISPDILDGFSQCFHHMKALYVQMMDLYLFSNLSRDVATATK